MTAGPSKARPARRSSRQARLTRLTAVGVSFLLAGFATVTTSRAAFTTTTSNTANTATAATVALTDGDTGNAMFTVSGMYPGQGVQYKCIDVQYTGVALAQNVKLYRTGAATGTGLDLYLNMTIEQGTGTAGTTGGATASCTGFTASNTIFSNTLENFMTTKLAWDSGVNTVWTPSTSPETRYFRVGLTLQDNNLAQGKSVGFGFTWEAQR